MKQFKKKTQKFYFCSLTFMFNEKIYEILKNI